MTWPSDRIDPKNGWSFVDSVLFSPSGREYLPHQGLTTGQVAELRGMHPGSLRNSLKYGVFTGSHVRSKRTNLVIWKIPASEAVKVVYPRRPKMSDETKRKISEAKKRERKITE